MYQEMILSALEEKQAALPGHASNSPKGCCDQIGLTALDGNIQLLEQLLVQGEK
jgi:hypothetical protein